MSLLIFSGCHDEGKTLFSLVILCLWDILYPTFQVAATPSYQSPFQRMPLDWGGKVFYESRKTELDAKLHSVSHTDVNELSAVLSVWREKHLHTVSLVSWPWIEKLNLKVSAAISLNSSL